MILALDAGTTSCRAILYDLQGNQKGLVKKEITQYYPRPGWVEHDALEIWQKAEACILQLLKETNTLAQDLIGMGITNQRETSVTWDHNGKPLSRAIVWQDQRTIEFCNTLRDRGLEPLIREKTGLVLDTYFSASKMRHMMKEEGYNQDYHIGTVDSWLIYQLTEGREYITDPTNASRTSLYNIHTAKWDEELCEIFEIPIEKLPEVVDNDKLQVNAKIMGVDVPIMAVLGDQQAALFGQGGNKKGNIKNTYGTGCFLLHNVGKTPSVQKGLLTTVAGRYNGESYYALEGAVFEGGSVLQWLRDEIRVLDDVAESEEIVRALTSNEDVYLVPAFSGLGSPYWDMNARGLMVGMTKATTREVVIRAALESIAFQSLEVVEAMKEHGTEVKELRADGGATQNTWLMQFQADLLGVPVWISDDKETTARGVAQLVAENNKTPFPQMRYTKKYIPQMQSAERKALIKRWKEAVALSRKW